MFSASWTCLRPISWSLFTYFSDRLGKNTPLLLSSHPLELSGRVYSSFLKTPQPG